MNVQKILESSFDWKSCLYREKEKEYSTFLEEIQISIEGL